MWQALRRHLIVGLVILLPVAMTFGIVVFLINVLTHPFVGILSGALSQFSKEWSFLASGHAILYLSKALALILLVTVTLILGILARWAFTKVVFSWADHLLHRIPFVKTVYKTSQEMIKTLFKTDQPSFQHVVLAPFPGRDLYTVGLVSQKAPRSCVPPGTMEKVSVLIPTTPNPTSGFLLICSPSDLVYLDISPETAIKYLLSMGTLPLEEGAVS